MVDERTKLDKLLGVRTAGNLAKHRDLVTVGEVDPMRDDTLARHDLEQDGKSCLKEPVCVEVRVLTQHRSEEFGRSGFVHVVAPHRTRAQPDLGLGRSA